MRAPRLSSRGGALLAALLLAASLPSCGEDAQPPAPVCDEACRDGIALRALREMVKLVFNIGIQGKPAGPQEAMVPCPLGGTAKVVGTAVANPVQGSIEVDLVYTLAACGYTQKDDDANETYALVVTATIAQKGTISSLQTATTALTMSAPELTMTGTVSNPPLDYRVEGCPLSFTQNGNRSTGMLCDRVAGFSF